MSEGEIHSFPEIWVVDTEYRPPRYPIEGDVIKPVCWCGLELFSGKKERLWLADGDLPAAPPHAEDALVVAYAAAAEAGTYSALGWPTPTNVLDLMPEIGLRINGQQRPEIGLLAALKLYGVAGMDSDLKGDMRDRILAGPPFDADDQDLILRYCAEDVTATAQLLQALRTDYHIDLPRALIRGEYAWHCGTIAARGIPVDVEQLAAIRTNWATIRQRLIEEVNPHYGYPYDKGGVFRGKRFSAWVESAGIPWPRLPSGAFDLKERTFLDMAKARPEIRALADLRGVLSQVRAFSLPVGLDGRARADLRPMATRSGRCAPKAGFIFTAAAWLRSLMRPAPGMALAYVDYSSEEILIAGILSGDQAMIKAYEGGDPYVWFGRAAGLIPPDGTKATHPAQRDACKSCLLGTNYGMGTRSLAARIGISESAAAELLRHHRAEFPQFWHWRSRAIQLMQRKGYLRTRLGWLQHNSPELTDRQAANFLVQATGADVLRAAVLALEAAGIRTLATVHDAVLIEAPDEEIEKTAQITGEIMTMAAAAVLGGARLRTDAVLVRSGDRYQDKRGVETWSKVMEIIRETESTAAPIEQVTRNGKPIFGGQKDVTFPLKDVAI